MTAPDASSESPTGTRRQAAHPARIVTAAFTGHMLSIGSTLSIYAVFIEPVAAAFGASMALASLGSTAWSVVNGLASPFLGRALTRISIRSVMLTGSLVLLSGLIALSRAPSLLALGILYATWVTPGSILVGGLPSSTLVANWFVITRGRALGIAAAGTTGGSVVFPPIAAWLIENVGWRNALVCLAIGGAAIAVPILWAFVVDRPEDVGSTPDGVDPGRTDPGPTPPALNTREILSNRDFWLVGVAFALIMAAGTVSMLFTVPYAKQLGVSIQGGALILAMRSAAGMAGKVLLGSLSDRVGQRRVLWGALACQLVLWTVLVNQPTVTTFTLAGLGLGFTGAALYPLRGALVGAVFGRENFSSISGLLSSVQIPFSLVAAPLVGTIFDVTGDYGVAFQVFLVVYVIAPVLLAFVRMPDRQY